MLQQLKLAFVFLTRLPARPDGPVTMRDLAGAVHMFPVVGAVVGLLGGVGYTLAGYLGLPSLPAALVALTAMLLATGALHEDGLADTADALSAGPNRERALEIMRDSRIGSYGTIALVVTLLARLVALASFWEPLRFTSVLIAAAAASRATMPVVMLIQPSARLTGLAASTGRPEPRLVGAGALVALLLCLLLLRWTEALVAFAAMTLVAWLVAGWLGRRFGGCTGDTLGAVQQASEITFLFTVMSHAR